MCSRGPDETVTELLQLTCFYVAHSGRGAGDASAFTFTDNQNQGVEGDAETGSHAAETIGGCFGNAFVGFCQSAGFEAVLALTIPCVHRRRT